MVALEEYLATLDDDKISSLSDGQEIAISLASVASAFLSVISSAVILQSLVLAKKHSPYRRILWP